jgi:hypothetical protein
METVTEEEKSTINIDKLLEEIFNSFSDSVFEEGNEIDF